MAVTSSIGYAGDVDETDWAQYAGSMGAKYSVAGPADLRPTISTTLARGVRIAAGTARGCGVIDTATVTDVQLPVVASGSRWFLIVLKRVWGTTKASTIAFVNSPQTNEVLPTRQTDPGVEDDQPLALALVTAGQTQVQQLRDLRVWATSGGAVAAHVTAWQYLTDPGTQVLIGDELYTRRVVGGSTETVVHDLSGRRGERPSLMIGRVENMVFAETAQWVVGHTATFEGADRTAVGMTVLGGTTQGNPSRIRLAQAGLYAIGGRVELSGASGDAVAFALGAFAGGSAVKPTDILPAKRVDASPTSELMWTLTDTRWINAGLELGLVLDVSGPVTVTDWALWATWLGN